MLWVNGFMVHGYSTLSSFSCVYHKWVLWHRIWFSFLKTLLLPLIIFPTARHQSIPNTISGWSLPSLYPLLGCGRLHDFHGSLSLLMSSSYLAWFACSTFQPPKSHSNMAQGPTCKWSMAKTLLLWLAQVLFLHPCSPFPPQLIQGMLYSIAVFSFEGIGMGTYMRSKSIKESFWGVRSEKRGVGGIQISVSPFCLYQYGHKICDLLSLTPSFIPHTI